MIMGLSPGFAPGDLPDAEESGALTALQKQRRSLETKGTDGAGFDQLTTRAQEHAQ
jgi:hypothetical protein